VAGNLKGRLSRLKALEKGGQIERASGLAGGQRGDKDEARSPRGAARSGSGAPPHFLEGWKAQSDFVYRREIILPDPLPDCLDPAPFLPRSVSKSIFEGQGSAERAGLGSLRAEDLVFLDFETTGLSGGAGTLAFLAALGSRCASGFSIRQYFLSDYPGERDFITMLIDEIKGCSALVSYNGRCFDYPLLRTRCVLNGLRAPEPLQLDLLFPARRLWRRSLGGAALGIIEEGVLGIDRGPDVDGALIPSLYFNFLKTGSEGDMALVMSHNASDAGTLASLMGYLCSVYSDPLETSDSALDRTALGLSLFTIGREEEAEKILESEAAQGNSEAFCCLSLRYRSLSRGADFERLWHGHPRTWEACVEGAKYFEHQKHDWRAALHAVESASELAHTDWQRAELEKRRARLEAGLLRSEKKLEQED